MTIREVFDKVKAHLLSQKKKALNDGGRCAYLNKSNLCCAIGCLIPPEKYDPIIEGQSLHTTLDMQRFCKNTGIDFTEKYPEKATFLSIVTDCVGELNKSMVILLCNLQKIHDNYEADQWEVKLNELERLLIL